jgi:hypothetical protein
MGVGRVPDSITLLVFMNRVHLSYIKTGGGRRMPSCKKFVNQVGHLRALFSLT